MILGKMKHADEPTQSMLNLLFGISLGFYIGRYKYLREYFLRFYVSIG